MLCSGNETLCRYSDSSSDKSKAHSTLLGSRRPGQCKMTRMTANASSCLRSTFSFISSFSRHHPCQLDNTHDDQEPLTWNDTHDDQEPLMWKDMHDDQEPLTWNDTHDDQESLMWKDTHDDQDPLMWNGKLTFSRLRSRSSFFSRLLQALTWSRWSRRVASFSSFSTVRCTMSLTLSSSLC